MEVIEETKEKKPAYNPVYNSKLGRMMGGFVIVLAGLALLLRKSGIEFPYWMFSFEMLIVTIGLYIWARHTFRRPGGLLLMLVGGFLLLDDIIPNLSIGPYIWPLIVISIGVYMIFSPGGNSRKRFMKSKRNRNKDNPASLEENSDDYLNSTSVFAGVKKRYFTKDFKGGKIVCFFGGVELDLSNSEIVEPITIDISQVFGGTKLIVPAHWQIKSEIVAIAGGVEDKRHQATPELEDSSKTVILRGTCIFGGIDIKSY
jgi:predicted membrane protein